MTYPCIYGWFIVGRELFWGLMFIKVVLIVRHGCEILVPCLLYESLIAFTDNEAALTLTIWSLSRQSSSQLTHCL